MNEKLKWFPLASADFNSSLNSDKSLAEIGLSINVSGGQNCFAVLSYCNLQGEGWMSTSITGAHSRLFILICKILSLVLFHVTEDLALWHYMLSHVNSGSFRPLSFHIWSSYAVTERWQRTEIWMWLLLLPIPSLSEATALQCWQRMA